MKRVPILVAFVFSVLLFARGAALASSPTESLLSSGDLSMLHRTSPGGTWTMEIVPIRGGLSGFDADAILKGPSGSTRRLTGLIGNPLFINDDGRVVTLMMIEGYPYPRSLCVYDAGGRLLYKREIRFPVNPILSNDGTHLAIRIEEGILIIDLSSLRDEVHPARDLFVVGPRGVLASTDGMTLDIGSREFRLDRPLGEIEFAPDGSLLAIDARVLERWNPATGAHAILYRAPNGSELRDLTVHPGAIDLGLRLIENGVSLESLVTLAPDGTVMRVNAGPSTRIPHGEALRDDPNGIPWPFHPDSQHSVGNSWGEYQNYGGAPYCHPGIDVFASPGDSVFAVHSGIVKAVLTTGGDIYWRVAISDSVTSGTSKGYLYAHLIQSSIRVHVGDLVTTGMYIGNIVTWPVYGFHHCHFARIQESGSTWADGRWLAVENPQLKIIHQDEHVPPVFEPARGTDLLAFCTNQTSTYQSPLALHGSIDIICHVGDTIASTWVCCVQQIRYTIYPLGMPFRPLVNDKESIYFNFASDEYQNGTSDIFMCKLLWKHDSTCNTRGDYDYREYYHIITNSNGDRNYTPSDSLECWNTSALPDRQWVIKVTAVDVVGNVKSDSMIVQTLNGNPSDVSPDNPGPILSLEPGRPNPFFGKTSISFHLPSPAERVTLSILDPTGRVVRTLHDGGMTAGAHAAEWDGRDARGAEVPAGMYFYKLDTPWGPRTEKLLRIH
jgi:hypothetical protein